MKTRHVIVATAVLSAWVVFTMALGIYGAMYPKGVTKKQVATAVANVAGDQNMVALCEANITNQINQAGGQVKKYHDTSVKTKGDTSDVTLTVDTTIGNVKLKCSLKKSNWTITNIVSTK